MIRHRRADSHELGATMQPGELWSLLEMLEVKAKPFLEATDLIAQLMIGVHGKEELRLAEGESLDWMRERLSLLSVEVDVLSLNMTKVSLGRLIEKMQPGKSIKEIGNSLQEVRGRLMDEIGSSYLLSLDAGELAFYDPREPLFGPNVAAQFPSAAYEITEAGKCFALGRSTATVFHLMRTVEIGVRAVSRCLQIPDPVKPAERNWGFILKEIKNGYEAKWPRTSDRVGGDGAFFEAVHASLDAIKNPWRNATMHVEVVYTPEEARHIYGAVEGFMRKISSRLDESGLPHA